MAIQTAPDNQNNNNAPGVAAPLRAPGFNESGSGSTPLFAALHNLGAGAALGQDVEKYIEGVKGNFPKDASGAANSHITVRRMSEPHGAHAFQSGDAVIVLMFDALLQRDTQNFTPSSDYGRLVGQAMQRDNKNLRLLHVVLVQPEDYARTQQMADYLLLNLAVANGGVPDNNISLLQGTQFTIDQSVDTARAFIEQYNPHATQPRIDIGFTIFARTPRQQGQRHLSVEESLPIAAVGAYVEIWLPEDRSFTAGPIKYAATVHITNISSRIPLPGIVPMCMAIAADQFIEQGCWLKPFMSFAKNKPNLGMLSQDPKDPKNLWFASNADELYRWKDTNMYPRPMLAVDVAEGQARIPAIAVYGDTDYMQNAYEQIRGFFGNSILLDPSQPAFNIMAQSFNGQYGDTRLGGRLTDSRDIDYLKLLAEGAQDPSARLLLHYNVDPAVRARLIYERTNGSFKSLYRTRISLINPILLATLAREIVHKVALEGSVQANRNIATPWLTDTMKLYQGSSFNTTAPFSGGNPTFGMRYGI